MSTSSDNIARAFAQRRGVQALQTAGALADMLEHTIAPEHAGENQGRIARLAEELRWFVQFRQRRLADRKRGK